VKQYLDLVKEVLERGTRKENRTGVDTISAFNINYSIDLGDGFPLLTTKEISWKNIVVENLWFLSGDLHIGLLKKHNCKFWDHWADDEGFVPSAYGNFWRKFPVHGEPGYNDQVRYVLDTIKKNPNSRRMSRPGLPEMHRPVDCLLVTYYSYSMSSTMIRVNHGCASI